MDNKHKDNSIFLIISAFSITVAFILLAFISWHDVPLTSNNTAFGHYLLRPFIYLTVFLYSIYCLMVLYLKDIEWKKTLRIIFIISIITFLVAIFSYVTRSQDLLWMLLMTKGYTIYHLNPYHITPTTLAHDTWALPVRAWRMTPMIYGPLWIFIIAPFSHFSNLTVAVVSSKIVPFFSLIISGYTFWHILKHFELSYERRAKLMSILALNPLIIQHGLVDYHGDILIMMFVLLSYFFLLKKKWYTSYSILIIGGFIKYIPWLIALIPAWYFISQQKTIRKKILGLFLLGILPFLIGLLLYAPFDYSPFSFHSPAKLINGDHIDPSYVSLGTSIITSLWPLSGGLIRKLSLLGSGILLLIYLWREKPSRSYVVPFIFLFFFWPWFEPWYLFWILPLLLIVWPPFIFISITTVFFLVYDITTVLTAMSIITILIALYGWYKNKPLHSAIVD